MESILISIKKLLGIAEEYTQFDADIIMHINSVFTTLTQIGVGPSEGFYIEDETAEWTDFVSDLTKLQAVKTYTYLKVRLVFDPSSLGSATLAAYERQIQEFEWRLNVAADASVATEDSSSTPSTGNTSGGVTDYRKLTNLPSINGETLMGNYDEKDPTVTELPETDVQNLWSQYFTEE